MPWRHPQYVPTDQMTLIALERQGIEGIVPRRIEVGFLRAWKMDDVEVTAVRSKRGQQPLDGRAGEREQQVNVVGESRKPHRRR